jgi:ribosomal protein S16
MFKNYNHYVIRLKKGKKNFSKVYWIIVILNKNKSKSQKIIERLGFFQFGKNKSCIINFQRLSFFLNKGYIIKKSVKTLIYLHSAI